VAVDSGYIIEKYGLDSVRFYLTFIMPEHADTSFTWEDFIERHNNVLIGNFGNFVNRTLKIAEGFSINHKILENRVVEEVEKRIKGAKRNLLEPEYKKYIEPDAAFERRFQPIIVKESTRDESITIIQGLKKNYEKYHNIKITDEAIEAAVDYSTRYLQDKFLPDKAIDLIDEAASKFKVKNLKNSSLKKVIQLKNDLQKMSQAKDKAIENDNYERAVFFRENEDRIIKELEVLSKDKLNYQLGICEGRKQMLSEVTQILKKELR